MSALIGILLPLLPYLLSFTLGVAAAGQFQEFMVMAMMLAMMFMMIEAMRLALG